MGDQAEYMEQLTVGMIVEGKVKSLTKFGAFITLPDGSTGMVHISEVAHTYVNDIHDHLHEGDTVKVPRQRTNGSAPASGYGKPANRSGSASNRSDAAQPAAQTKSFDDMLKKFMSESDSKMSSIRAYSDRKTKTRRR